MKRTGIIIATVALVAFGLLAFATPDKTPDNPKTPKNNYETMWKKVKENLEKNLPESAEKELVAIEEQASKDLKKSLLPSRNKLRRTTTQPNC